MIKNENFKDNVIMKIGSYAQLINRPEHGGLDLNETGIVIYPDGNLQFVYRPSLGKIQRIGEANKTANASSFSVNEVITRNIYALPNKLRLPNIEDGIILLSSVNTPLEFLNLFKDDYTINKKMTFNKIDFRFLNNFETLMSETDDGKLGSEPIIVDTDGSGGKTGKVKLGNTRGMYLSGIELSDLEQSLQDQIQPKIDKLKTASPRLIRDFFNDIVILDPRSKYSDRRGYIIPELHKNSELILVNDSTPRIKFDFTDYSGVNILFQSIGDKDIELEKKALGDVTKEVGFVDEYGNEITKIVPKSRFLITYDSINNNFIVKGVISSLATEFNSGLFLLTSLKFLLNNDHLTRDRRPYAVKFDDFKNYLMSIYTKLETDLNKENTLNDLLNISNLPKNKDYLSYHYGTFEYISKSDLINKSNIDASVYSYINLSDEGTIDIPGSFNTTNMWKIDVSINSNEDVRYIAFDDNTSTNIEVIYDSTSRIYDNVKEPTKIYLPIEVNIKNTIIINDIDTTYNMNNNISIILDKSIKLNKQQKLKLTLYDENFNSISFNSIDNVVITALKNNNVTSIGKKPTITNRSSFINKAILELDYDNHNNIKSEYNNTYTKMYMDSDNILDIHYNKLINKPIIQTFDYDNFVNFKYQINITNDSKALYSRSIYDVLYNKQVSEKMIIDATAKKGSSTNDDIKNCCTKIIELEKLKATTRDSCIDSGDISSFVNIEKTNAYNIKLLSNDEGISIFDESNSKLVIANYDKSLTDIVIKNIDSNIEEGYDGDKFRSTSEFDDLSLSNSIGKYGWNVLCTVTEISKDVENIIVINNMVLIKNKNENIKYVSIGNLTTLDLSKLTLTEIPNTSNHKLMMDYINIISIDTNFIYIYKINNGSVDLLIKEINPLNNVDGIKDIVYNKTLFILTDDYYYIGNDKYDINKSRYFLYLDIFGYLNYINIINPKDKLLTHDIKVIKFTDNRSDTAVDKYKSEVFPELVETNDSEAVFYDGGYMFKECRYMIYNSKDVKKYLLLIGDISSTYKILLLDNDTGKIMDDVTSKYKFRDIVDPGIENRIPALQSDTFPTTDLKTNNYRILINNDDWDSTQGLINQAFLYNTTLIGDDKTIILYDVSSANTMASLSTTNTNLKALEIEKILKEQFYVYHHTFIRINININPLINLLNFANPFRDYIPLLWNISDISYFDTTTDISNLLVTLGFVTIDDYLKILDNTIIKNTLESTKITRSFIKDFNVNIVKDNNHMITLLPTKNDLIYDYSENTDILNTNELCITHYNNHKIILKLVSNKFVINIDNFNFNTDNTNILTDDILPKNIFLDDTYNDQAIWFVINKANKKITMHVYDLVTYTHTTTEHSITDPYSNKIENIIKYKDYVITIVYREDNNNIKVYDLNINSQDFSNLNLSSNININKYSTLVIRNNLYLITTFISGKSLNMMYNITTLKKTNDYYNIDYASDLNEIELNLKLNIDDINTIPNEYNGYYISLRNNKLILVLGDDTNYNIISKFHFNANDIKVNKYGIIVNEDNIDRSLVANSSTELLTNLLLPSNDKVYKPTFIDEYNTHIYLDLSISNLYTINVNDLLFKDYTLVLYNYNYELPTVIIRDTNLITKTEIINLDGILVNDEINFISTIDKPDFNNNLVKVNNNIINLDDNKIDGMIDITNTKYNITEKGYLMSLSNTDVQKIKVDKYRDNDYILLYERSDIKSDDILVSDYIISNDNNTKISIGYNGIEKINLNINISDILYPILDKDKFIILTKNGIYKNDKLIIDISIDKFYIDLTDKLIYIKSQTKEFIYDYRLDIIL